MSGLRQSLGIVIAAIEFMKIAKIALYVVLAGGILAAGYFLGYRVGKRDDWRQHLGLAINKDVFLYSKVEDGDMAGVKNILGKYVSGELQYYEQHFREERSVHLDAARRIARAAPTNEHEDVR